MYHCTYTHMHNIRTADYISQHIIPYKFHSLCAGEAAHLSSDFRRICETYFPHAELAQIIARQHTGTPQAQHRVSMVKQLSKSLLHTHNFYFWLVLLATIAL